MAELTESERLELEALRMRFQQAEAAVTAEQAQEAQRRRQMEHWPASKGQMMGTATARGVMQGATLGFADEIGAALGSGEGDTYSERADSIRAMNDRFQQEFPEDYGLGQFAGGAMTALIPGAQVVRGASLAGRMARGGAAGAGVAAAQEIGMADPGQDRTEWQAMSDRVAAPWDNRENVALGGAIGAAAPAVAAGVGAGVRGVLGPATRETQALGYAPGAARRLQRSVAQDARADASYIPQLSAWGDEAMVADLGPATRAQAGSLATIPGDAQTQLVGAVNARQAGRAGRVARTVDDATGGAVDLAQGQRAMAAARGQDANQLYAPLDAFDTQGGQIDSRAILTAIQDAQATAKGPVLQALKRAERMMFTPGGALDTSARGLHNARSALSEMANAGGANPVPPGVKRALTGVVRDLDGLLDGAVPGYARARQTYAEASRIMEAARDGRKVLATRDGGAVFDSNELRARWGEMSEAERDAFRMGARVAIEDKMAQAVNEGTASLSVLGPRDAREKMRIIFGDAAAEQMANRIDGERAFMLTHQKVSGGPETAQRLAGQQEFEPLRTDGGAGVRMSPVGRVRNAVSEGANRVVDALMRPGGEVMGDVARGLTATGADRDALVQALLRDASDRIPAEQLGEAVSRRLERILKGSGRGITQGAAGNPNGVGVP